MTAWESCKRLNEAIEQAECYGFLHKTLFIEFPDWKHVLYSRVTPKHLKHLVAYNKFLSCPAKRANEAVSALSSTLTARTGKPGLPRAMAPDPSSLPWKANTTSAHLSCAQPREGSNEQLWHQAVPENRPHLKKTMCCFTGREQVSGPQRKPLPQTTGRWRPFTLICCTQATLAAL